MKSFIEHLTESEKVYEFKIRVAGELPEGFDDKLEMILKKYDLVSISSGTKTPIQSTPYHFPRVQNAEVYTFDAEVRYPITSPILQSYISDCCGISKTHLVVTSATEPFEELAKDEEASKPYEPKLTTLEMEQADPDAQKQVGEPRVMDLLRELEAARKERNQEPTAGTPTGESTDISPDSNTKSVIGA
jgi:hypothetical protein|tara:strand:- start:1472 stop:2038 length:567 start_codon:yes stop_codon:yes gene_type:complete